MGHWPFLNRYLKRDEILSSITACDVVLNDALGMFGVSVFFNSISRGESSRFQLVSWQLSIQIRTLKLVQANKLCQQQETQAS